MDLWKRLRPMMVGTIAAGLLLGGTACSRVGEFQSVKPYTPAEGVQADIIPNNAPDDTTPTALKLRNVMLVEQDGEYVLAGAVVAPDRASLTSVEGVALDQHGAEAGEITFSDAEVDLEPTTMAFLEQEDITAESDDLQAGLLARLTFTFDVGATTLEVPVVDGTKVNYENFPNASGPTAPIEIENS